ncbi:predicted protein [Nematostella vectensis]|uniref:EGF-like domain-containing protein n=1 Tax=Nematostella vectensis TaxID=45351 RepID=A7T1Q0_NEMVE|nr:predicted protein [Nematostella vectensis]|eukprot:XP_001622213.1 predicted protein [Nematostella vectensis]
MSSFLSPVDKCSSCDVHAHCENGRCVCDEGYSGDGTKGGCFKDGAANPRFCLPSPCLNGGSCQELPNGYVCLCEPGFNGRNCEKDLGEYTSSIFISETGCCDLALRQSERPRPL